MIKKELIGQFIKLTEINEKDFAKIIEWRNNPSYNKYINQTFVLTMDLQKKWYEEYLGNDTQITYGIHLLKDDTLIGTVGATDIDFVEREFIPGRLLIDEGFRFGPYLIDSFITLYGHFFEELGFIKAYLHPVKQNKRAISTNKQFGFKETGHFINEKYKIIGGHEMIEMVCDLMSYSETKQRNLFILSRFGN